MNAARFHALAMGLLFLLPGLARAAAPSITVTSLNDSGPGSLRQAIADAAVGTTMTGGSTRHGEARFHKQRQAGADSHSARTQAPALGGPVPASTPRAGRRGVQPVHDLFTVGGKPIDREAIATAASYQPRAAMIAATRVSARRTLHPLRG